MTVHLPIFLSHTHFMNARNANACQMCKLLCIVDVYGILHTKNTDIIEYIYTQLDYRQNGFRPSQSHRKSAREHDDANVLSTHLYVDFCVGLSMIMASMFQYRLYVQDNDNGKRL